MAGTCPNKPLPPPSCDSCPCDGAGPYDAATGAVEQQFSFLQTSYGSFDMSFYNLYVDGGSAADPNTGLSPDWSARQFARMTEVASDQFMIMFSPTRVGACGCSGSGGSGNTYWFRKTSDLPRRMKPVLARRASSKLLLQKATNLR